MAGGIDDLSGKNFCVGIVHLVLNSRAINPPIRFKQAGQLAIIHAHRTGHHGAVYQLKHQPRIVGLRIGVGEAAFQASGIEKGKTCGERLTIKVTMSHIWACHIFSRATVSVTR